MEKNRTKTMDRISALPESILHHILSFVPFKKVAQTSVLSKRWERVWRTYPVLEFDQTFFGEYYKHRNFKKVAQRRRNELFNCVAETMCNRHKDMISLMRFKLSLPLFIDREFTSFVNRCVCHAIGCNVNELELLFSYEFVKIYWYSLPQVVLFAKSLEILTLQGCKVEFPRSDLNLSSLRKLNFQRVHIDDHTIKNLVGGCPLIEHLSFRVCEGFKNVELFGLPRLDEIVLDQNYEVKRLDIKSPNVRSLTISWLDRTREINLASCKNLTTLMLSATPITDEWLDSLISKLPVLAFLSICECNELRTVKISSPCLEELDLCECKSSSFYCKWIELKIDTPKLRSLKYEGAMKSLSLNANNLLEIDLQIHCLNVETEEYIEFLASFHHFSKALDLEFTDYEDVMVPGELRQTLSSPLSSLELLNLRLPTTETCVSIAKVVDGLLWIAPHTKTISISIRNIYSWDELSLKFQFTYKKQLINEGETPSCCKSHPISCWDHCMDAINVEFTELYNSNSISYALRGARLWEKIVALSDVWELLKSA